ncbi:MAG: thymidylate kinase [Oscillospiraceae bacterium]|nr:thymidylate kinase [Oscillospiraceae bacterium]MBR6678496.1 thymidylate kinase [Oscillospiraceae bacterium]
MKGKLIVFEGTDGSGKATQTRLLVERLQREGKEPRQITFPRYDNESSALIRMYLGGEFGTDPGDVNAYAASAFYAVDRFASYKQDWGNFYENGGLIVADRYTTSNAVHQASKLPKEEREPYLNWLFHFEYALMGLPKPDVVFYLDIPTEITGEMRKKREADTNTTADIHEKDEQYLRECRSNAAEVAKLCGWERVDCVREGRLLSVEEIHEEIVRRLEKLI